jgi:hypothetical protein
LRSATDPAAASPAGSTDPFWLADCWLWLGTILGRRTEPVAALPVAAALASDGDTFGVKAGAVDFVANGLSPATAEKNGLDGTDDVVTHPVSADASMATMRRRLPPASVLAKITRAVTASDEGHRTRRQRSAKPRTPYKQNTLDLHMHHSADSDNRHSSTVNTSLSLIRS